MGGECSNLCSIPALSITISLNLQNITVGMEREGNWFMQQVGRQKHVFFPLVSLSVSLIIYCELTFEQFGFHHITPFLE